LKRRDFLVQSGGTLWALNVAGGRRKFWELPSTAATFFSAPESKSFSCVLELLFPQDEDSPGAVELGALKYFEWAMNDAGTPESERSRIKKGLERLEDLSREKNGRQFWECPPEEQKKLFEIFLEKNTNERWASLVLSYLLEAVLGDPVYGGNAEEKGWKWIEHTPGFPRPPHPGWSRKL
jgi:gluconate 2-dehydrogenase gamma chain